MNVSVVVPVHGGLRAFRRCLEALRAASPAPHELIVAADGDEAAASLAEGFGAKVLRLSGPGGPARARNAAAQAARGDVLLFVDADVAVHPDAVGRAARAFAEDAGLAAVFGSYDDAPAEPNFLSQYKNLFHHYVHQNAREEASTFWAGLGAVRREVFLFLGGFDESYRRPCVEDIELGRRLASGGHQVRLDKGLLGKHLKRWDALSLLKSDLLDRALPWTEIIVKEGRAPDDLNLGAASRASAALAGLGLLALLMAPFFSSFVLVALFAAAALAVLNAPLYGFFRRKRGLAFTAGAVLWHWFYYLYASAGFAAGVLRARLG